MRSKFDERISSLTILLAPLFGLVRCDDFANVFNNIRVGLDVFQCLHAPSASVVGTKDAKLCLNENRLIINLAKKKGQVWSRYLSALLDDPVSAQVGIARAPPVALVHRHAHVDPQPAVSVVGEESAAAEARTARLLHANVAAALAFAAHHGIVRNHDAVGRLKRSRARVS